MIIKSELQKGGWPVPCGFWFVPISPRRRTELPACRSRRASPPAKVQFDNRLPQGERKQDMKTKKSHLAVLVTCLLLAGCSGKEIASSGGQSAAQPAPGGWDVIRCSAPVSCWHSQGADGFSAFRRCCGPGWAGSASRDYLGGLAGASAAALFGARNRRCKSTLYDGCARTTENPADGVSGCLPCFSLCG